MSSENSTPSGIEPRSTVRTDNAVGAGRVPGTGCFDSLGAKPDASRGVAADRPSPLAFVGTNRPSVSWLG